ncbi:MAG TPA: DUF998 domain-containing protein [Acidimicrobiales bacterium]|nr:DUF998 domain-containing protein [Acidimicrobiales bacterium]
MNHLTAAGGWLDLLGLVAAVSSLVFLHFAPTGLSPMRNPVSQYGITPYRAGYRSATIGLAIAGAGAAVGVAKTLSGRGVGSVVALLVAFAVARAVISWYPMDAPDRVRTSTGHTHGVIAVVTFAAATLAALQLGRSLAAPGRWHALSPWSTGLGLLMAGCVLGMALTRRNEGLRLYFGLVERGLYVAIIAWLAMLGVALVHGA